MLQIKNITCGYNKTPILHDITCSIKQGDRLGIIGPNGSGKTTLIKAMTSILSLDQGKVFFQHQDIQKWDSKTRAQSIAVVSQNFSILPMKVKDYVLLGRAPYYSRFQMFETKKDREVVEKAMEITDTLRFQDAMLDELSGGEQQLVAIARALAQEPKLLILDEPTAHLDIAYQKKVMDLITKLNHDHFLTVVMVLHDLNLARKYCSKLLLMNNGAVHIYGTPEKVITEENVQKVYGVDLEFISPLPRARARARARFVSFVCFVCAL